MAQAIVPARQMEADARENCSPEEIELRVLFEHLLGGSLEGRDLVVTAFGGNYGEAGTIIVVNGSPPRGTIVVLQNLTTGPRWYPSPVFYLTQDRSRRLGEKQATTVFDYLRSLPPANC